MTLVAEPDPAPLSRTLLRLRHDFVMIGRAAAPFPGTIAQRLAPLLTRVGEDVSEYLRGSAAALLLRRCAPSLAPAQASLKAYDGEVNALRKEGLTRAFSTEEVERLFALGFMLEQIQRNLADLARCVQEWAEPVGIKARSKS